MTLLSKPAILRHLHAGSILIDPFDPSNLGTNSYDVTLGKYCWREGSTHLYRRRHPLYNPYDQEQVQTLWEKDEAKPLDHFFDDDFIHRNKLYSSIGKDDLIILLDPGESILAHTQEFVGSGSNSITTKMFARSSTGRNFLHVCACAGLGDVGFNSIWTMEIFNRSRYHSIPLVVGRRYAQISFFEVESVADEDLYAGKYQKVKSFEETKRSWKPEYMVPRMYMDREVKRARS